MFLRPWLSLISLVDLVGKGGAEVRRRGKGITSLGGRYGEDHLHGKGIYRKWGMNVEEEMEKGKKEKGKEMSAGFGGKQV